MDSSTSEQLGAVMTETKLPQNVEEFCRMFPPSSRLCRFVNRRSGTLLDVRPNLDVVNNDVPRVVGMPESAGVQYWLITTYGDGQAIIPVPKDGSKKVRYLTPSSQYWDKPVTVSPFPTSWILLPSSECQDTSPLVPYSYPMSVYEDWTCLITWPHYVRNGAGVLDLWGGDKKPETKVVIDPYEHRKQCQYWRVQFIHYRQQDDILPILPVEIPPAPSNRLENDCAQDSRQSRRHA